MGQASIFFPADFSKLIGATRGASHRLIFQIAYFTAARCGEVRRLPVSCVFGEDGKPLPYITYPSEITKSEETRQVPVSGLLRDVLRVYWRERKPSGFYLFPGKDPDFAIQFQSVDDALRRAIKAAGLEGKGYSCHSFRRSAITKMSDEGIGLPIIQEISGHKNLANLRRYIEVSEKQKTGAIAVL